MSSHSNLAKYSENTEQEAKEVETQKSLDNEQDSTEQESKNVTTATPQGKELKTQNTPRSAENTAEINENTSPYTHETDENLEITATSKLSLHAPITSYPEPLSPGEISRISLQSFQLCTRTPPNSETTSYSLANELFPRKLILCIGLCTLDIVHICEEFPVENAKQLHTKGYWQRGGNASINCTVLRNLGAACEFLGMMSKAPAFTFLLDDCHERGIIIDNCPLVEAYPPFSSILACRPTGTFTIIHTNLGFPALKFEHFRDNIQLQKYNWIHMEARNPEETLPMLNMIRRFNADILNKAEKKRPVIISLELAKNDKNLLYLAIRANLVFMGRGFALHMGWSSPKEAVYNLSQHIAIMQLREEKTAEELDICFHSPHIVCPWGSEGCSLLTSSYVYDHVPALEIYPIVDAKGAGDTFVAAVIYSMNNLEMDLKQAVRLGCKVAVFKMQHMGLDCIKDYTIMEEME